MPWDPKTRIWSPAAGSGRKYVSWLPPHEEDGERAGHDAWPGTWLISCRGRRRSKLRRHQVNVVRLEVQRHSPRAALGLNVVDHGVLVGRVLVHYGQRAVAVRAERQARSGIEGIGVYPLSDRRCGYHLPVIRVQDDHHLVVAA